MRLHTLVAVWLAASAVVLAGCAPTTKVILLPQADGSPSAVVVRSKGGEQVVDKPYQRATAQGNSDAAPTLDTVDPARLRASMQALFDFRPPEVESFMLYFVEGETALTDESKEALDRVVKAALPRSGSDITVTGHTDTTGNSERNDELSFRRAEEIRTMLMQRGFPGARIEAVGRGERELAVPTADEVNEARNRRVAIEVR